MVEKLCRFFKEISVENSRFLDILPQLIFSRPEDTSLIFWWVGVSGSVAVSGTSRCDGRPSGQRGVS